MSDPLIAEEPKVLHEPPVNPAPPKGILKKRSIDTTTTAEEEKKKQAALQWDEEKLQYIAEHKDYGFMKIDEPKTPYHAPEGADSHHAGELEAVPEFSLEEGVAGGHVAEVSAKGSGSGSEGSAHGDWSEGEDDEHARTFKAKRKQHYNEYQNVKLARQLLAKEGDNEEEEEQ
eukprot:comp18474_c0_seq1/m.19811 comp18474_c0_seq1/g.19811  ORF comp18474_c0_seq1/g.19811 comp18474_c0_seq1/m.19811 type:complete len:173 (-) comp18474_c0_seq1:83-601(-)